MRGCPGRPHRAAGAGGWRAGILFGAVILLVAFPLPRAPAGEVRENVALHLAPREILLFSAQAGAWTSIRLDAGERILRHGSDGNVAAVVTSQRAVGFSALLNLTQEVRLPEDEGLEAIRVEGNLATLLTRRRALGFSALTGRWAEIERFQLGR